MDHIANWTNANLDSITAMMAQTQEYSQILKQQSSIIDPIEFTIYLVHLEQLAKEEVKPIVLNNIFFESGSARLLDKSEYELTQLLQLLRTNHAIKMEIRGHTDNVGKEEDNQLLSEQRAKAIYDYLITKGIEEVRLTYRGFGETLPLATNDSEDGRQKNRRTEFLILNNGQK